MDRVTDVIYVHTTTLHKTIQITTKNFHIKFDIEDT